MTPEQKTKAYDEAIKKAKALYGLSEPMSGCNVILETIFPELRESEDERIRKALINFFSVGAANGEQTDDVYDKDILAWLEKQGKRKSVEWSEKDENELEQLLYILHANGYESFDIWLKSLKGRVQPKQEWGDEDNYYRNCIIQIIEEIKNAPLKRGEDWDSYINWLKSLRPQKQWKPSDEQMDALHTYIYNPQYFNSPDSRMELVESVYKELKKLKEE